MIDYNKIMCGRVQKIPPSGIRKYFDLLEGMEGGISLGIGEPDFVTPCISGMRVSFPWKRDLPNIPQMLASPICAGPSLSI